MVLLKVTTMQYRTTPQHWGHMHRTLLDICLKKKYNTGTFITLYFRQKATCSYSVDETFLKSQNYSVSSSVNQVNGKVE